MIQSDQRLNHSVYEAKYNSHDSLVTEIDSAIINMTVMYLKLFAKWAEYKLVSFLVNSWVLINSWMVKLR